MTMWYNVHTKAAVRLLKKIQKRGASYAIICFS